MGRYGSHEVRTALEALGMEDVEVEGDRWHQDSLELGKLWLLLRATKGYVVYKYEVGIYKPASSQSNAPLASDTLLEI